MTTNYINLNLPVEPAASVNFEVTDINKNQHWLVDSHMFSEEFINFLNSIGLDVGPSNVVFYTPPQGHLGIHIDGDRQHNNCMLNYVWGSANHKMIWYDLKPEFEIKGKTFTNNDSYISVPENMSLKIDETTVGYPTLVRVGSPHSIENRSDTGRWCLSIDLKFKGSTDTFPGIDIVDAEKIFKGFII